MKPSRVLKQDQILREKLNKIKNSPDRPAPFKQEPDSTSYDKEALNILQDYYAVQQDLKNATKDSPKQVNHHLKAQKVKPKIPHGVFKNSDREHVWNVTYGHTLKIPALNRYNPKNKFFYAHSPEPLITDRKAIERGKYALLKQETTHICDRLKRVVQVEDPNKVRVRSIFEQQSYDTVFNAKSHVLVINKLKNTLFLNDEIFGKLRPEPRYMELEEVN